MADLPLPSLAKGLSSESALPLSVASKFTDLPEWRLREYVRAGVVPSSRVGGRYYLFVSDLKATLGRHWKGEHMATTSR
jgi:hypothetical protein